jgi:hypothetical protein
MDNPGGRQTKIEHMNGYQSVKSKKKSLQLSYNTNTYAQPTLQQV